MNNPNLFEILKNPKEYVMRNYGITEDDPNTVIQNLMNSGKITQAQYNNARNMAMQIRQMMK